MAESRTETRKLTPWYPKAINPVRIGLYQTSREDCCNFGSAYNIWDGQRWQSYPGWGDYSKTENMVWRGLARG